MSNSIEENKNIKNKQLSRVSSICTLCTEKSYADLRLFLYSVKIFECGTPVFIACDSIVAKKVCRDFPELDIGVLNILDKYANIVRDQSKSLWTEFMLRKTDVIDYALQHCDDTLFLDCDIFLADSLGECVDKSCDVGLSPHYIKQSDHDLYGRYNGGFVWTRSKKMTKSWRKHTKKSRYHEQAALEDVYKDFKSFEFGQNFNFGWWRVFQSEEPPTTILNRIEYSEHRFKYKLPNERNVIKCFHTHLFEEGGHPFMAKFNSILLNTLSKIKTVGAIQFIYQFIAKGTNVPLLWIPRDDGHAGDTFRELAQIWENSLLCKIVRYQGAPNTNLGKHVWLNRIGDVLLYDRPKLENYRGENYKIGLWGNPEYPKNERKNAYWTFWARRPILLHKHLATRQYRSYDNRPTESVFLGKVENSTQAKFRNGQNWKDAIEEFDMVTGAATKYKYTQEEYLEQLAKARFGLCLRGYGPKCNREIELMAFGTVPLVTPDVDIKNYDEPWIEGKHFLRVGGPEDVKKVIAGCTKEKWTKMSAECREWFKRNCAPLGAFNTTMRIVDRLRNADMKVKNSNKRVAILVASTSKSCNYKKPEDYILLKLMGSMLKTLSYKFKYKLYVGYDKGDPFFEKHHTELEKLLKRKMQVELIKVDSISGSNPCYAWNFLANRAYGDGFDYLFQTGDDILYKTKRWDEEFVKTLQNNDDIGITGAMCSNIRIITNTFVSRKHLDIFKYYFPPIFKNWWSDDWINSVYKSGYHYWRKDIIMENTLANLKKGRYEIQECSQNGILKKELVKGRKMLDKFLISKKSQMSQSIKKKKTTRKIEQETNENKENKLAGVHPIKMTIKKKVKKRNGKPLIALNMIVKDEAHIITEVLGSVYQYIDYFVISDTGSTDSTKAVIKDFFERYGIDGEIHDNPWKDFGYNRSVALDLCKGKAEYAWVIDADDLLVGNFGAELGKLTEGNGEKIVADCYNLKYGTGFTYWRSQIFRVESDWRYVGVLHEYPECRKPVNGKTKKVNIEGNYYVSSRRLGRRSQVKNIYERDAEVLENALIAEPKNSRYVFYLAQSYKDCGNVGKAIENYKRRISMGGWYEEVAYSHYQVGKLMQSRGDAWKEVENAYVKAHEYCKTRAEPLYEIAKHYREGRNFAKGYSYAKRAHAIKFPKDQLLFLHKEIYDWKIADELAICGFYVGQYEESKRLCEELLVNKVVPSAQHGRIRGNMKFSVDVLAKRQKEKKEKKETKEKAAKEIAKEEVQKLEKLVMEKKIKEFKECCDKLQIQNMGSLQPNKKKETHEKREKLIRSIEDYYISYEMAKSKIDQINTNKKSGVVFSITTCKRFDLFEQTMNSFINCCEDLDMIDKWICVDDNSSKEDRKKMKELYPFMEFIWKDEDKDKGHPRSMNIILDKLEELKKSGEEVKYLLHMEDDWKFFDKRRYIKSALEILEEGGVSQVLFNLNYAEVPDIEKPCVGGFFRTTEKSKTGYVIHQHYDSTSTEYKKFMVANGGALSNAYWPYFSFRPSIIRTDVFNKVGRYSEKGGHFELEYAKRYKKAGYKSAFFDVVTCLHTGKKTWEKNKDKPNAYALNGTKQF